MRLVFMGAPGSGKGTQSLVLSNHLKVPQISTGDMLREAVSTGSLGRGFSELMEAGGLVPDDAMVSLVERRTAALDARGGFLLDGFPRTMGQAVALDGILAARNQSLTSVIVLEVATELLVERACLRRTDKRTGQIYHLKYKPPPAGADLAHRSDDFEEVVRARLEVYSAVTAELVPYYDDLGLLAKVDGVGSVADVSSRVLALVDQMMARKRPS